MSDRNDANKIASIDLAIGLAVRYLRENHSLTARQLAAESRFSAAMISRIENGQTSPSISTLNALSRTLDVPLVSFFRETSSNHVDFTHVKDGEGLYSTRIVDYQSHEFINLAFHTRCDLQFEARRVTSVRQTTQPPTYVGHGVLFVHALSGEAIYSYGQREFTLKASESLSLDADLRHGFKRVITDEFSFLTIQAERR